MISTIVGVVVLTVLDRVVGAGVLYTLAVLFLLVGIAYKPTYPVQAGALSAMAAVLLVAGPSGDLGTWAVHRLLDTLLGCAMALASMYLLWPKTNPTTPRSSNPRPGRSMQPNVYVVTQVTHLAAAAGVADSTRHLMRWAIVRSNQ